MRDYIFIIGASGVGKSTLAKGLLEHYKTTCVEQYIIPEFYTRDGKEEMTGELEELTCWENQVAMLFCFHKLGYKNIIACDLDDLRTRDIPIVFKGYDFITIKLICSDGKQLKNQMKKREKGGLIDYKLQEVSNKLIVERSPLVNEFTIDVAKLSAEEVAIKAKEIIDIAQTLKEYEYSKPNKELFYSWVFSNGLR